MENVPTEPIIVPQPSREPVAALRASFDLNDLLHEDGRIIVPEDQEEGDE